MRLTARLASNPLHDTRGRIGFRRERKKHFVVLVVKFAQRGQISFKARFDALAGTQDCRARRIESRIGGGAAPCESQPADALINKVQADQDLHQAEKIKYVFHALAEYQTPYTRAVGM